MHCPHVYKGSSNEDQHVTCAFIAESLSRSGLPKPYITRELIKILKATRSLLVPVESIMSQYFLQSHDSGRIGNWKSRFNTSVTISRIPYPSHMYARTPFFTPRTHVSPISLYLSLRILEYPRFCDRFVLLSLKSCSLLITNNRDEKKS